MENSKYTVTKTSSELYKFRHPSGAYWADITLDAGEKSGRISIASDFGTWSNYWGSCGNSFKRFLTELDIHYAAGKFGSSHWFDHEGTIRLFRQAVADLGPDQDNIFELKEEISSLLDYSHRESFVCAIMECDNLMRLFDGQPDLETSIEPGFKKFWETIWPIFTDLLKAEELETQS